MIYVENICGLRCFNLWGQDDNPISNDSEDYTRYVETRNVIMGSHHGQGGFYRWYHLAGGNAILGQPLNDIVNALLDGVLDLGPTRGEYEYFVFDSGWYYDYVI